MEYECVLCIVLSLKFGIFGMYALHLFSLFFGFYSCMSRFNLFIEFGFLKNIFCSKITGSIDSINFDLKKKKVYVILQTF